MKRVIPGSEHWRVNGPKGYEFIPRDGRWTYNGDPEKPTFSPSILERWNDPAGKPECNHFFVTDGAIQYLDDCTHEFAGKTVELQPLSPAEVARYYGSEGEGQ